MRKQWLHWIVGRDNKSNSKRRTSQDKLVQEAATSAGCMCAVFQMFDLPFNEHHFLQEQEEEEAINTSKGVEAPRNSLEVAKPVMNEVGSKSLAMKEEQNLNFPVGMMHIKTGHEKISSPRISTKSTTADDGYYSSETKTPTLVARLMGLDLLPPESNSPSFSNSKPQKSPSHLTYQRKDTNILVQTRSSKAFSDDDISVGARSLPETPRISSSRRSDVDYYHHRLSLQVNKENCNDEFRVSSGGKIRSGKFKGQDENTSSPRHFAQQIMKQVKESVSRRRVGLVDITNTKDNNKNKSELKKSTRRDENLVLLKPTKKNSSNGELISPDMTPPSCSPRLRFLETNKPKQLPTKSPRNPVPFSENNPSKLHSQVTSPLQEKQKKLPPKVTEQVIKSKKVESFVTSKVANKQSLVNTNKAKKATLSSEVLSISGPSLLPVKKGPSPAATKLPQKQSQVSDAVSVSSKRQLQSQLPVHPYQHLPRHQIFSPNSIAAAADGDKAAYGNYIKRILKRARITNVATSHPLDPCIFHYLELFGVGENSVLSCRSNRKLVFHLVDELLSDISTSKLKPISLADELCTRVSNYSVKKCEVLEDIDELVGLDLSKNKWKELDLEKEMERVVREIEGGIFEKLVFETVAVGE